MARYGLLGKLQVVHGTIAVSCTYLVSPGVLRFVPLGERHHAFINLCILLACFRLIYFNDEIGAARCFLLLPPHVELGVWFALV